MNPAVRVARSRRKRWPHRWEPKAGPCPWLIRLARERWELGGEEHPTVSQKELGRRIGLSPTSPWVCLAESYRQPISAERLARIAKVLLCEPEDLCAASAQEAADNRACYLRWVEAGKPILRGWLRKVVL